MDEIKLKALLEKYTNGTCTPEEIVLLESWYLMLPSHSKLPAPNSQELHNYHDIIWADIQKQTGIHKKPAYITTLWPRVTVAASIILCLSFGGYYLLHKPQSGQNIYKNDVAPGHNQATLTLANGQKILLTKGMYKKLAQGNASIQINNGVTYTPGLNNKQTALSYNTLSTATGEESPYPLILPDGSKVWLNAQSSITFPTVFNGKERIVKITGEALFEVAHNAKQPFKVQTARQTIEDIGTTFDVNSYADEPVTKTTLIEGKVKVNNMFLEPGQQTDGTQVKTVNTKRYIAWKNDDFYFENDDIQTVMRELSRWYNVKVDYEGDMTTERFDAQMSRNKNISSILQILENTKGVHFKIEGRRVTVIE